MEERWLERRDLVTDDLHQMYWNHFGTFEAFTSTNKITCEWVEHPNQRHKIIKEGIGTGINRYKQHYNITEPLKYKSTGGNYYDEVTLYKPFRERPDTPFAKDGLKILLVGELAFSPERILALEERGHKLYGLWMRHPWWFNSVGPLPFGHVEEVPYTDWQARVRQINPDVIYGLLNVMAIPHIHQVFKAFPDIPFVWHMKESPLFGIADGHADQMADLYLNCDGLVHGSPEIQQWLCTLYPKSVIDNSIIIDGDLPKREWFEQGFSEKLSATDGEIHTVVAGRPMGLTPEHVAELAREGVHFHIYGEIIQSTWKNWVARASTLAPNHFHTHKTVSTDSWQKELSQYDAGWLHYFDSDNDGSIRKAYWNDLNYPARIGTYMCAGIPLLQKDNTGHIVATQALAERHNIGLTFNTMQELAAKLKDRQLMASVNASIMQEREKFTFDYHADALIGFFRQTIDAKKAKMRSIAPSSNV